MFSVPHQTRLSGVQFTLDLETILSLFRQENLDRHVETRILVRRRDLLHSAVKVVRRPDFCFRKTPIISFSGEETSGNEGPLGEFFRFYYLPHILPDDNELCFYW